jgi:integrase
MKVTFIIRKKVKRHDLVSKATVYVRLRAGRNIDLVAPAGQTVNPNCWDRKAEQVKNRKHSSCETREVTNDCLRRLKSFIEKEFSISNDNAIDAGWLKSAVKCFYDPSMIILHEKPDIHSLMAEFLQKHQISEVRKNNYRVIDRALNRYELYVRATVRGKKTYRLDIDGISPDTLHDIFLFLKNEHTLCKQHPAIYGWRKDERTPRPRGKNTINDIFTRLRTFLLWCYRHKKTGNRPFDQFRIEECSYGTPIYLTLKERDMLLEKDFSDNRRLEVQRDIFIFQSLTGCRIGDLYRMTRGNIVNGALEYIPRKTKDGYPVMVRVPLNSKAKAILDKYAAESSRQLLPFASEKTYNALIKTACRQAKLDRTVSVLDPLTNEEVKKPLYEIVSSHMARRTFIGNIYKKVKDPNLIGALSGHKEGSRAFSRYREIDDDIKRELVSLLD